jgi:hypothetical protein
MSNNNKEPIILQCPHCQEYVIILEINCAIFRHAIFKNNGQQIDPHTPKNICEEYIKNNKIYGCGKPFKIIKKDNTIVPEICDYI